MGDQDDGVGVGGEVLFEPVAGFQVQVVGRLVEQQQVGFGEQQLGKRDAHLPPAGEFLGPALPVPLRKPQAGEHDAGLRFHGIPVARAKLAFRVVKAVGHLPVFGAIRVQFGHAMGELLLLVFERAQIVEHGHAFGKHGTAGKRQAFLRQVAEGVPVPLAPTSPARSLGVTSQSAFSKRILGP